MQKIPKTIADTYVPTLNKMGYMTKDLDYYSQQFVKYVTEHKATCLEIGAAYGVATIPALAGGATVIANDIDNRHLEILQNSVPLQQRKRLTLLPGRFPEEMNLSPASVDAALICRVMHFFPPQAILDSANKLFSFLKPNGKVFVVAETPYNAVAPAYIPIYEEKKKNNDLWPGFIEQEARKYIREKWRANNPDSFHLLDPDVLHRVFSKAGFIIEQCDFFARDNWPNDAQYDGRESVGLIAKKNINA